MRSHLARTAALMLAAAAAALLAVPSAARAVDVTDPGARFAVTLDAPGASVCAAYPAALRNPAACPTLVLPATSAFADASERSSSGGAVHTAGVVYFVYPDWRFFAVVVVNPMPDNARMGAVEQDAFIGGVRQGTPGHLPPGVTVVPTEPATRHDELDVDGVQVLRNVVELDVPPGDPPAMANRMLMYHVIGRDVVVSVMFSVDARDLPRALPLADAMMRSARVPKPPSQAARLARVMGTLAGCAAVPLAIAIVVSVLYARRRRAAAGAMGPAGTPWQQQPMGGWQQQQPPPPPSPPQGTGWPPPPGGGGTGWPPRGGTG